jgi:Uma2 family endonuclease
LDLTEDQFFEFCQLNRDLQIERTAEGEWQIMTPVGVDTSDRESEINMQLRLWAKRDRTGTAFSSSGGFRLANGAVRSPDAAWMLKSRLAQFSAAQRQRFLPACPDFVLELRSPSDRLADLQTKMAEYIANGARLGWLLDPEPRHVYVYRPDAEVERLDNPEELSGAPVLPGFVLDLREIW